MASEILEAKKAKKKELLAKLQSGKLFSNINQQQLTAIMAMFTDIHTLAVSVISSIDNTTPAWFARITDLTSLREQLLETKQTFIKAHTDFLLHTDVSSGVSPPDFDNDASPNGLAACINMSTAVTNFNKEMSINDTTDWKSNMLGSVLGSNAVLQEYYAEINTVLGSLLSYVDSLFVDDTITVNDNAGAVNDFLTTIGQLNSLKYSVLDEIRAFERKAFSDAGRIVQQNLMLEMLASNQSQFEGLLTE